MREAIKSILSDKENKEGIHVQNIVDALIMRYPEVQGDLTRDKLLNKVNSFFVKGIKRQKG